MINSTFRHLLRKRISCEESLRLLNTTALRFEKDEPPNDDRKKKETASQKLDNLLKSIIQDNLTAVKEETNIEIPKPRLLHRQKKAAKKVEIAKQQTLGEKIVDAAKEVAETVQGDKKETEAQLLHRMLYKGTELKDDILKAASPALNLKEIIAGMEVEKSQPARKLESKGMTRADQVKSAVRGKPIHRSKPVQSGTVSRVSLYDGKPLGLFNNDIAPQGDEIKLETWERCYKRELKLSVTHPPSNIYEQMILWTERDILWKFPIDNEQGMEDEKKVYFADHVFLETHLEDWCPTSGPIRHFMELVCVGLSRNYWLTAEEKKAHIMWYKEYFSNKSELIKELGAGEIKETSQAINP